MNESQSLLSKVTTYTKYSRYREDLQRRETWDEIIDRYVGMMLKKHCGPEYEIQWKNKKVDVSNSFLAEQIIKNSQFLYEKKVLPSMRALQFAGPAIEKNESRGYNCFSRETRFITSNGVRSFYDFKDGDTCIVPTHTGSWKKATIRHYGKQMTYDYLFRKGRSTKVITATENHRWLLRNGIETTNLDIGNILDKTPDLFNNFNYHKASIEEKLYWCYGFVYGDGTLVKDNNGKYSRSMVRLCGDDVKYEERFTELGFKSSTSLSLNGDVMVYTGKYLKTAPDPKKDNPILIRAFCAGYCDADAYKNNNLKRDKNNFYVSIQSSDLDHIHFIQDCFEIAGLYITNIEDLTGQRTNYGIRPETFKFSLYNHISGKHANVMWSVRDKTPNKIQDVWCLEVEDDHSFILSGGLVTGNCAYLPMDNYTSFSELMFLLLGGTGVGYSVQFQHIRKLPEILKPSQSKKFLISDSIEGWADSIKALMKSYFGITKYKPKFDYSDIRAKGERLITAGGKAPGPEPLKIAHTLIESILNQKADNSQLTSFEVHLICCIIADAVLAGGIRRAALICLFSFDDIEMATCKHGAWWEKYPQLGRANNSAVIVRNRIKKKEFKDFWKIIQDSKSGEPGISWTNDPHVYGWNPCFTGDTLVAVADGRNAVSIKQLAEENYVGPVYTIDKGKVTVGNCSRVWKTRENSSLVKVTLNDGSTIRCTPDHRFMLRNGYYIKASDLEQGSSLMPFNSYKRSDRSYRMISSNDGRDLAQYRHIAQYNDLVKEGYEDLHYHHKDGNGFNDHIFNLEVVNASDHLREHKLGDNNPIHSFKDRESYKDANSKARLGSLNPNWSGVTSDDIINKVTQRTLERNKPLSGKEVLEISGLSSFSEGRLNELGCNSPSDLATQVYEKCNHKVVSVEHLNEKEDVYDLTVDCTHNFAVISSTSDELAITSSGVFVHNCHEISLREYSFCNLTEINAGDIKNQEDFNERAKVAAFFGTLQAGFIDFHYLRSVWKKNTEKDSLIGVGITGIANGKIEGLDLTQAVDIIKKENEIISEIIGINPAARTTTIKPSGTTSCVLGTSSGIHAWHSSFYIRNIQCAVGDDLYHYFNENHPEIIKRMDYQPNDAVIGIPMKAPSTAIFREDEDAIQFLERVKHYNKNWVQAGHNRGPNFNNVSATVNIKEDEWDVVGDWMWTNREVYSGISVIPYDGGTYRDAPFQDCTEYEYNKRMKYIRESNIDLTKIIERTDNTKLSAELACAGGACEINF